MASKKYTVKREHLGDKPYAEGDEREANEADVKHLVESGVLEEKSAKKPSNKAAAKAKNKSG